MIKNTGSIKKIEEYQLNVFREFEMQRFLG